MTSGALEEDAYGLLRELSDQPLSFVDGISLCLMRQEKIPHAFAFDPDFVRAGFLRVPVDVPL
ncbi:MAG: hypothetical protein ACE5FK_08010 [Candidatus Methylomirabilia bacterium]